ncbi:MAG TPA: SDR family oxidoreductase, partial [Nitrosopumilaceae archaeon]|nr:SDR family oxidoreductase [Nitrosopumilaceae archaeon]
MRLQDKVAIVTGASSDIGASIVKRFIEEGANVVLLGRNLESLEKVRKSVGSDKKTASMICDVTDEAQIFQIVDQVMDKYGKIDILVNGAGALNDPIHFHEMPDSEIKKIVDINIHGVFKPTKAVLNKMSEVKKGVIINIGSISSERAIPRVHLAVYSATKAAVS